MSSRIQLWSCGGGRQSAGIAAMIKLGRMSPPDHACMVKLEWEIDSVWPYVNKYIVPALVERGIPFTEILRTEFATVDFFGGAEDKTPLLPVFTNKSGKVGKLSEYCSGEWKRNVAMRWAARQPGWKDVGVDNWVGISLDERSRRRNPLRKWIRPTYPLLDVVPMGVADCLRAVAECGWPTPPRSRCRHCPNQSDAEWLSLSADEFAAACDLDDELRKVDPNAFLHKQCVPLRVVNLNKNEPTLFTGGCSAGMCY